MFKAQVLRRSFSLWRRGQENHIIRSAMRDGHENVQVQRVRFRTPFFSRSRILGTAIIVSGTLGLFNWLDDEEEEEEWQTVRHPRRQPPHSQSKGEGIGQRDRENGGGDLNEEDEEDEDEDDTLLFLPTGFPRQKPRYFYKGSDPEWQEFVNIAKDPVRADAIKHAFIRKAREEFTTRVNTKTALGNVDRSKGSAWVELHYPAAAPNEYERPGIEITDELEVRRVMRPVQTLDYYKLQNTVMPSAAYNAVLQDAKRRVFLAWKNFKESLGLGQKSTPGHIHLFDPQRPFNPTLPTPSSPPQAQPSTPNSNDTQQPSVPTSPPNQTSATSNQASASPLGYPSLQRILPQLTNVQGITQEAMLFRRNYQKTAVKAHTQQPPRGCLIVTGLVELLGDTGRATLDCRAYYDPKQGKFVVFAINVRSIRAHRQRPHGGEF